MNSIVKLKFMQLVPEVRDELPRSLCCLGKGHI